MDQFLQKTVLISPKNFLNFKFDTVEKLSIINLCSYNNESYAFGDFEAIFLREVDDAAFCSFLYCVKFIDNVA